MKVKSSAAASQAGFTLIELVVTMAIIAVLAGVAIPSYIDYLRRGAVEEAIAALSSGKVAAEQYYLDNRTYDGLTCPVATSKFAMTCEGTSTTYTLTATGSGNVSGFIYTVDQADARTTDGDWGAGDCWILRKGQSCP